MFIMLKWKLSSKILSLLFIKTHTLILTPVSFNFIECDEKICCRPLCIKLELNNSFSNDTAQSQWSLGFTILVGGGLWKLPQLSQLVMGSPCDMKPCCEHSVKPSPAMVVTALNIKLWVKVLENPPGLAYVCDICLNPHICSFPGCKVNHCPRQKHAAGLLGVNKDVGLLVCYSWCKQIWSSLLKCVVNTWGKKCLCRATRDTQRVVFYYLCHSRDIPYPQSLLGMYEFLCSFAVSKFPEELF